MGPGKAIFPKGHPTLDGDARIPKAAKKMDVIGHQQVIAYQPSGSFIEPDRVQGSHDGFLYQPVRTVLGAHGHPKDRRLIRLNVNPFGRSLALGKGVYLSKLTAYSYVRAPSR
jgi:hypothetical protein